MRCCTRLGVAGGIVWGACIFLTTWLSIWTGYGAEFIRVMGSIYPGFAATAGGSLFGLIWGFVDAFVLLWLVSAVYCRLSCNCRHGKCSVHDKKKR